MIDDEVVFCRHCGRAARLPAVAAAEDVLACPWCDVSGTAAELRSAQLPEMLPVAASVESARPKIAASVAAAPRVLGAAPRSTSRGAGKSPTWELAKIVLGGAAGLAIGYFILLYAVGRRADFLHLAPRLPEAIAPAWAAPAAAARRHGVQTSGGDESLTVASPATEVDKALARLQAAWEAVRRADAATAARAAIVAAYADLLQPLKDLPEAELETRRRELAYWLARATADTEIFQELEAAGRRALEAGRPATAILVGTIETPETTPGPAGQTTFHPRGDDAVYSLSGAEEVAAEASKEWALFARIAVERSSPTPATVQLHGLAWTRWNQEAPSNTTPPAAESLQAP